MKYKNDYMINSNFFFFLKWNMKFKVLYSQYSFKSVNVGQWTCTRAEGQKPNRSSCIRWAWPKGEGGSKRPMM